jgi:curved DNA-binding protein CbpA
MAPTADPKVDVFTLMDAYAVLEVENSVTAGDIRRAYRRLASHYHPDRFPAGSPEQQHATRRMAAINDAYRVVSDAPLRHHRVGRGSERDVVWTDAELDEAVRRARSRRLLRDISGRVAAALFGSLLAIVFAHRLSVFAPGLEGYKIETSIAVGLAFGLLGSRFFNVMYVIDVLSTLPRLMHR